MSRRRAVTVRPLFLVLSALAGCVPDGTSPVPTAALSSSGEVGPRLESVVPATALHREGAAVTLRGSGFNANLLGVSLVRSGRGGAEEVIAATDVRRVSGSVITATFPPVASQQVGRWTVVARFSNDKGAALADAFLYRYDQDPVVFVHGCPLPPGFGSVTNYITSKYWHRLYNELRGPGGAGYPAPEWAEQDEFETNLDHAATRPGPGNYLNVFVLSEDARQRVHEEDDSDPARGGHCGSGLKLADELDAYVDRVLALTGAERVDLVVNSGGALGARWYLRHYDGAAEVREAVFLAAMNHGTDVAIVPSRDTVTGMWTSPNYDMAREGFPAYACRGGADAGPAFTDRHGHTHSGSDLQWLVNGCLVPVRQDQVAELPADFRSLPDPAQGVSYLSVYNVAVDELIEPTHSACLNQRYMGDCTDLEINVPVHATDPANPRETPHGAIRADPEVVRLTACHLRTRSPARPEPAERCEAERLAASTR